MKSKCTIKGVLHVNGSIPNNIMLQVPFLLLILIDYIKKPFYSTYNNGLLWLVGEVKAANYTFQGDIYLEVCVFKINQKIDDNTEDQLSQLLEMFNDDNTVIDKTITSTVHKQLKPIHICGAQGHELSTCGLVAV